MVVEIEAKGRDLGRALLPLGNIGNDPMILDCKIGHHLHPLTFRLMMSLYGDSGYGGGGADEGAHQTNESSE
jgi:hypothetical protein